MIRAFPEVERVFGKAGRAETSTDPAPFSMMETTVLLKPPSEWRFKKQWYSDWAPEWLKKHVFSGRARAHLLGELIASWIKGPDPRRHKRMDHADQGAHRYADAGVRTPIGIKVFGPDLRRN